MQAILQALLAAARSSVNLQPAAFTRVPAATRPSTKPKRSAAMQRTNASKKSKKSPQNALGTIIVAKNPAFNFLNSDQWEKSFSTSFSTR